ncbi:MAG: hypothetical protein ACLT9Y_05940 [Peptostreptococcus anaerobius]
MIPSRRELAGSFGVNLNTVQKGICLYGRDRSHMH